MRTFIEKHYVALTLVGYVSAAACLAAAITTRMPEWYIGAAFAAVGLLTIVGIETLLPTVPKRRVQIPPPKDGGEEEIRGAGFWRPRKWAGEKTWWDRFS